MDGKRADPPVRPAAGCGPRHRRAPAGRAHRTLGDVLTAIALAAIAAAGTYLLYTALALGWRELRRAPARVGPTWSGRMAGLRHRWGLDHLTGRRLGAMTLVLFVVGVLAGVAIFAAPLPAVAVGVVTAVAPPVALRRRHQMRVARAQECWPRLIDEIRVLTASAGRSIPQALFEVGSRAPRELRPAFSAAHREWLLSTDFERTTRRLKSLLADPTADATCETLLVAHQLGGTDLDRRLEALAQDRRDDVRGRKEARARQAGARFARRFVLLVPAGMALAGMSVGNGRTAYATPLGQAAVVVAMGLILVCWLWAGRYLQGPHTERVLSG